MKHKVETLDECIAIAEKVANCHRHPMSMSEQDEAAYGAAERIVFLLREKRKKM